MRRLTLSVARLVLVPHTHLRTGAPAGLAARLLAAGDPARPLLRGLGQGRGEGTENPSLLMNLRYVESCSVKLDYISLLYCCKCETHCAPAVRRVTLNGAYRLNVAHTSVERVVKGSFRPLSTILNSQHESPLDLN